MTIFDAIQQSQTLLDQISSHQQINNDVELTSLTSALSSELDTINAFAKDLNSQPEPARTTKADSPHIDEKSGCYKFDNEQGFFCPNCYDQSSSRVATKRLNRLLRVCPNCRASIKPTA
ncbi:hypothetical protein A9Q79_06815 [Methylophaga sp. 42_25_T18]|nr:hypothetical protein A9Q79_06815 [Methylophaga sp. 42_25_T18]